MQGTNFMVGNWLEVIESAALHVVDLYQKWLAIVQILAKSISNDTLRNTSDLKIAE